MWMNGEVEPGIYTDPRGNTVQSLCDYTEAYINKNIKKKYFKELIGEESGWLGFEVDNTQKYDDAMAAGICLIAAKNKSYINKQDERLIIENILPYKKAV